jgi:hypothetical protein
MKNIYTLLFCFIILNKSYSQTALTGISTTDVTSTTATTYTNAPNTYNWSVGANNVQKRIAGFSSAGGNYAYSNALNGVVKMRRINNAATTGDFSLVWCDASTVTTTFNMQAPLPANMESYFDDNIYNKGTDNLFDNTSANSNNIERLDWILSSGYSTVNTTKVGFAVFERGADNAHDAFAIAAITGLDASGNPNNYGTLKKVISNEWGNITSSSVTYRIMKGASGTNLVDAGSNSQNRGGIFLSLADLGIAANTTIYGYSIFASDVPAASTPAQLSDVSLANAVTYPTNSGAAGGIDLIATTGIFVDATVLPIKLESFSVAQTNTNNLNWKITDYNNELLNMEIQKSVDGRNFNTIEKVLPTQLTNNYNFVDADNATDCLYRIKLNTQDGKFIYSTIIKVSNNKKVTATLLPNPVNYDATLNFYSKQNTDAAINIYDATGKKISSEKINIAKGINGIKPNNIASLKAGQYVLVISIQNEKSESIRFVKN